MPAYQQRLAALEPEQRALVEQLKQDVKDIVQQHQHLQAFCHEWTYVRYLTARQWNLPKASKMLRATLEWRVSTKPHEILWDTIAEEGATGKQVQLTEIDKEGRPVCLMRPRNENTKGMEGQLNFLVFNLERASFLADKLGTGKMTLLVDYEGYSMRNAPALKTSMACLNIMQNHYPERLGAAICWHAPSLFSLTWKAVSPFIDPVTAKKIVFINKGPEEPSLMNTWFDMSKMEEGLGGTCKKEHFVRDEYAVRMRQLDSEYQQFWSTAGTAAAPLPAAPVPAANGTEAKGEAVAAVEGAEHQPIAVMATT